MPPRSLVQELHPARRRRAQELHPPGRAMGTRSRCAAAIDERTASARSLLRPRHPRRPGERLGRAIPPGR